MVDHVTAARRSAIMSAVGSKNTKPEMIFRSAIHKAGFRYRLHVKELAGRPDLVFPKLHTVVFINGCFWHRHRNCKKASTPKSNKKFWNDKFIANVERDAANYKKLKKLGWRVVVIWECSIKTPESALKMVHKYFGCPKN